jgi:hypothetical protein
MKKLSMEIINPNSAGIDVGSRFHMVAIDQNRENVRQFGVYTSDHQKLINWLKEQGIINVAMESTGSYWQTLFDSLQKAGFNVILVNGNQVKNVKGKKTDVLDCLWIQKLHALGLLNGSFLPRHELQILRTYYSHRQYIISQMSKYVNKMQKAMRLMNIRLDVAIRDIMGKSGRAIIESIVAGERDAKTLAGLVNYRVKKSKEEIAESLQGSWREDLLFELKSCLNLYNMYKSELEECDLELEYKIKNIQMPFKNKVPSDTNFKIKDKTRSKNAPLFDIGKLARDYFGVDLMQIPGVSYNTVLCFLIHVGHDIYKFPSSKHFCSWLRLAPNNKITGGNVINSRTPKGKNRLALALRQAANSIGNQKEGELVSFFKRVAYRKDRASAITATARKLASIIYRMITDNVEYQPNPKGEISQKVRNTMIKRIQTSIFKLKLTDDQLKHLFLSEALSEN